MLRTMCTPEMIAAWKEIYAEYVDKLSPNRKNGQEILDYLRSKYDLIPFKSNESDMVVSENVLNNEFIRQKLPAGKDPKPVAFWCTHDGNKVFVGIDLTSGFYHVEDCEELWDELCAYQGLDEADLKNYFCVAQYIDCLKKYGKLETILHN